MPGGQSLPFRETADNIAARAIQIFAQIAAGVADRCADEVFGILLPYRHVPCPQDPDLQAKVPKNCFR